MNKLLKDNSYWQPILFKGAKTETEFSSQPTESKSGSCAQKLKPQDSGYTIIESLVAMIVVSVLMIAIAPVMAYSVAIRVQARRIELAAMAGRAYVDALRAGAIRPNDATSPVGFPTADANLIPAAPTSSNGLYCVDTDGGGCIGNKDFYIQGVRPPNKGTTIPTDTGYNLIVRVYRADGFTKPMTTTQQSVANSALGNPQAPLVVMQSQIPPTTGEASSYGSLCTRLQGAPEKCTN
ncbi:MAG: type II secretion system protein [Oscillatoriales cyanobacterium]|uniref:Hormogonium polysaccharide secretion pseudopilin HpsB n=2 Tax=Microcoleus TaxID=44471 RepID=A0ABU8YFZ8_9CYAN|nr:MAG: type II secretion system protein [Oscillatoriales cyanobacterium]TAD93071.1 MAG: type II secretion system protein [Oscillatoriales cyanobacterium]TAE05854.1 MAG: type II secretion system protein [Oscillatoriales cyanobacterium]TAF54381.1 MAG: type II secretion system protein [Oscillatoriales cyanobacterium]